MSCVINHNIFLLFRFATGEEILLCLLSTFSPITLILLAFVLFRFATGGGILLCLLSTFSPITLILLAFVLFRFATGGGILLCLLSTFSPITLILLAFVLFRFATGGGILLCLLSTFSPITLILLAFVLFRFATGGCILLCLSSTFSPIPLILLTFCIVQICDRWRKFYCSDLRPFIPKSLILLAFVLFRFATGGGNSIVKLSAITIWQVLLEYHKYNRYSHHWRFEDTCGILDTSQSCHYQFCSYLQNRFLSVLSRVQEQILGMILLMLLCKNILQ
jgi:hypothetical protein